MSEAWECRELLLAQGFSPESVRTEGVPPVKWLFVGDPVRRQGWKLHLSSRSDQLPDLISAIAPILLNTATAFKVVASSSMARVLNGGEAGRSQVGKVVTIYPEDDGKAVTIGTALVNRLNGFPGPVIENELRLAPRSPVYTRYGSFVRNLKKTKLGLYMDSIEDGDGKEIPDLRSVPMYQVLEVASPFQDAVEPTLDQLIGERFLRIGPLAETSHSIVEIGVDVEMGQPCVLKLVKRHSAIDSLGRDAAHRLKDEWELLFSLEDIAPVPRTFTFWEDKDWAVLAMEQIQGHNLVQYIEARQHGEAMTQGDLARLACQITELVRTIHAVGVIIGDLSPANIMIDSSGAVTLIDFEFAGRAGNMQPSEFGTVGYTSPAVLAGGAPRTEDDLYSLGAIIYYLVTGTDLSKIPGAQNLLLEGNSLPDPWKKIVTELVSQGKKTTMDLLKDTIQRCEQLLNAVDMPEVGLFCTDFNQDSVPSLPLLERIGTSILSLGHCDMDGTVTWMSRHPSTRGEEYRDFNMGDAGIAFGLLRIGLATNRIDFVEAAVNTAERLWSKLNKDILLPGLFIGEAGVGWLYLVLYELLGDSKWLDRASNVSRLVAEMQYESPDLFHGTAGRGLFHTWVYRYTNDSEDLSAALSAATHLRSTCERTSEGPLWSIPAEFGGLKDRTYYGIAHGNAGIAYFLAELSTVITLDWANELMHEIGDSLSRAARWDARTGLPDWPDSPGGVFQTGVWCHGSTGIALVYLRMYQMSGKNVYLPLAIQAAESALRQAHRVGPTQCHGLAGLLEVYLDLYEATEDSYYLLVAKQLGERLQKAFVADAGEGPMICAESPNVLTSEFMVGSAGAAAALARLDQPSRFGHFLRSPHLAFQTQPTVQSV